MALEMLKLDFFYLYSTSGLSVSTIIDEYE